MPFFQDPPELGNQYRDDRALQGHLERVLSPDVLRRIEPELEALGELAGGELRRRQEEDRALEPRHVAFDAWGRRVDRIELVPLWARARELACEHGLVALPYERPYGAASRIVQFALVYLFDASTDTYSCPLAMSDGAAATLSSHPAGALLERALPRLTTRDPRRVWTSGQWMTERTGGSDVGRSETRAEPAGDAEAYGLRADLWRLYGSKWFTSAAQGEMALTLARPAGAPEGGRGLTLYYLETRDEEGRPNGLRIDRLKDKLGTRKLPTAEMTLDGTLAAAVGGTGNGIRNIAPMLNVTRTWNAVCSVAGMRRGIALARDYARRRVQFGSALAEKPLHVDTLAGLQAELEGALELTFRTVALLGRVETGDALDREARLVRLLTPLAKLVTAKQCVAALSEVLECFGGAGYVEDTGLPRLLRDAQVLPIWEGTTNVLSLDLLRAIGADRDLAELDDELQGLAATVRDGALGDAMRSAREGFEAARRWLGAMPPVSRALEAGARRFAFVLGRSLELALLCRHAQWALDAKADDRPRLAALRFAAHGLGSLDAPLDPAETATLALE
jgi:alkylation response protein AidB-like acyl-CoA dehydrogenase